MAVTISGGGLQWDANINMEGFNRGIASIERQMHGLTNTSRQQVEAIDNLVKKTTGAIAAYTGFSVGTDFVREVFRVRAGFEQLEISFETMLGSREKAQKLMADVTKFAATTPFELAQVSGATRSLLAFGVAAEDIQPTLKALGDVSAGVGAPIEEIAELYGKAKVQGRLFAEDMNQLTGRGIPIIQELAKQFGTTDDQVKGLVESGKIGFPQLEKAFQSLTAEGSKFGGLMQAQSKSLAGSFSNLQDSISQMLNDIGKSNQGIFSEVIKTATSIVTNYQKIIDIIKILAITYGTYRAALLLTTAAERFQERVNLQMALSTNAVTVAQGRQAAAIVVLKGAWQSLLQTMASFAPIAVVAALGVAIYSLTQTVNAAAQSQKNLNDVQAEGNKAMAQEKANIEQLTDIINDHGRSRSDQLDAVKRLREETGHVLDNYSDEEILAGRAKTALDSYTDSIYKNAVAKKAQATISDLTNQLADLETKGIEAVDTFEKMGESLKSFFGAGDYSNVSWWDQTFAIGKGNAQEAAIIGKMKAGIKSQIGDLKTTFKKELEGLLGIGTGTGDGPATTAVKRTVDVIDAEIKKLKEQQSAVSETSNQWNEYAAKIKALEEERKRITGATKADLKEQESLESKINALLNERKGILDSIESLKRDSAQSGMLKEASAVDKVSEKYSLVLKKVEEYNDKIKKFNATHKGANVQGVGLTDINALKAARDAEISNTVARQDAERFIKSLDEKRQLYEQYADAVKTIGVQKADEMYGEQTKGFQSYIDFLKAKAEDSAVLIRYDVANVGDRIKFDAISKELVEAERKVSAEAFRQRVEDLKRITAETQTYNQKRISLENEFQEKAAVLRKNYSGQELVDRMKILREKYNIEERELKASLVRQSAAYKTMAEDMLLLSTSDLKANAEKLKQALKDGFLTVDKGDGIKEKIALTPQMIKDLESGVQSVENLNREVKKLVNLRKLIGDSSEELKEMAGHAQKAAAIFSILADAIAPMNAELAEGVSQIADLANTASSALSSLASGDLAGAITTIVGSMVKSLVDAAKSAKEAKAAVADFYAQIVTGEYQTAQAARERMLAEAAAHKLTLERLAAQKRVLEESKKANREQAAALLQQLQQEQYVTEQRTKKGAGNPLFGFIGAAFGLGGKTKVEEELQSLAGMTFDQIEKLFNSGQLTDKATELFQQLQKLKQEGVDIDRQLQELALQTQQIFTGTTADELTNSIAEMFKQGKVSAQDFAQFFEERMSDAALSIFKNKAIAEQMQRFYEQFAAAAQSGNELTETEINALRQGFTADMELLKKQFEQMQQITGLSGAANKTAGSGNALAGAIKGISADQANVIAGNLSGMRLHLAEALTVAKRALEMHIRTEQNTANTVAEIKNQTAVMITYFRDLGIKLK